ncbi:MAG: hypothetical protein IKR52_08260 [Paludibacteraceae bacterium]|nr:hypothetical protein [Paludibacteraceae bacterium]
MENNPQDIKLLKKAVGEKYGRPIKTASECNLLAQEITASVAGEQISQKTVQRLFQQNMTNFSLGILNVLAKYIGYNDYYAAIDDLKEKNAPGKYFSHSLMVGKYKLHDAMIIVLNQNNYEMAPEALADEINRQGLYEREDKLPLPAEQILMRVETREKYFTYDENKNIVSLNPSHRNPADNK